MLKRTHLLVGCPFSLILCLTLIAPASGQIIAKPGTKENDVQRNAFVPAPREFSRPIKRAKEAIAEQNYRDAAAYLGEVLAASGNQDYLGYVDDESNLAVSLRREAQRLLRVVVGL